MQVTDRTMVPLLAPGDELKVQAIDWEAVHTGQVVVYRLDGDTFATGRVWRKRRTRLDLRCDNAWGPRHAWREDLVGRVVAVRKRNVFLPLGGWAWRLSTVYFWVRQAMFALVGRLRSALSTPAHGSPAGVHLNVTSYCNLACKMCPFLHTHVRPKMLEEADFVRLLPELARLPSVHVTGAGEPLIHPGLVSMLRRLRAANPKMQLQLTTNGTLLTEAKSRELLAVGLDHLTVSLDGASAATTESIRIGVNRAEVLENLTRFTALKRKAGLNRPILRKNCMVGFGTYAELAESIRTAARVGLDEVQLLELQFANAAEAEDGLLAGLQRDGGASLKQAFKLASHLGVRLLLPLQGAGSCSHPEVPHLAEEGQVFPCCYLAHGRTLHSEGRDVLFPSSPMGNLREQSFTQIWNSSGFKKLRQETRSGQFSDLCRSCMASRVPTTEQVRQALEMD
jgi:MoaA/NifB/PqqE/SkfB family radical SAM enzyme